MVGRDVVRDEVEDQAQAAPAEPLAQAREGRVAPEVLVHAVLLHREARARDVRLGVVRQRPPVLLDEIGLRPRDPARRLARLPDPEEPDEVESVHLQRVQLRVRQVV